MGALPHLSRRGAAAMFELQNGLILALYGRGDLASDANATFEAPGSGEFSIGHLVGSRDEVEGMLAEATAAGATLTEEPHDRPWGIYSGYFRDPDGAWPASELPGKILGRLLVSSGNGRSDQPYLFQVIWR